MANERILLTGVTGFLGGTVAAQLLHQERWRNVLMLVRAKTAVEARQRVLRSLRRFDVPEALLAQVSTDQILCGDLGDFPSIKDEPRLAHVSRVVNCAAITSFGKHPQTWRTNVEATHAFARRAAQLPHLKRFIHVGTAMICGTHPPPAVREDSYPARGIKHLVDYTASKSKAEILLRRVFPGLPLVIVRPSIIAGHTLLGCKPSPSIFWTLRVADTLRMVTCDVDGVIDIVPVDYAAKAILHLLFSATLQHSTYHISAGMDRSSSFREIGHAFARALGETRAADYRHVSYADIASMKDQFPDIFGPCNKRFMLKAIKLYGAFASLNVTFDNRRLLGEGFDPPPAFADYLGVCVQTTRHTSIPEQMLIDFV